MTLAFYDLTESPFATIPDTRFLYVSGAHRQALQTLLTALQQGVSSVMLLGPPGLGKTTLLFHLFRGLETSVTAIFLFQPPRTPVDLLRAMLADLGVLEIDESPRLMLDLLTELLREQAEQKKQVVLIIDQAQSLDPAVLELMESLANPPFGHGVGVQLVLSGLATTDPPRSHVSCTVVRLEPLDEFDTANYMEHRLRTAGYDRQDPLFSPEASLLIARSSGGVPRAINDLCLHSLSLGYQQKRPRIEADIVRDLTVGPIPPRAEVREAPTRGVEAAMPLSAPFAAFRSAPASASHRRKKAVASSELISALGLIAAVLLTASATLLSIRRHAAPATALPVVTSPAASVVTSVGKPVVTSPVGPAAGNGAPISAEMDVQGMSLEAAVAALNSGSLMDVCKANFGKCGTQELQEVHKLNARLIAHVMPTSRLGSVHTGRPLDF